MEREAIPVQAMRNNGDKAVDAQDAVRNDGISTGADDGFPAAWRGKPFAQWQGRLLTQEECSKVVKIVAVCGDARDVKLLVTYATSQHGLVEDEVRRIAWPILLGYDASKSTISPQPWRELPQHRDEDQVKLDVNRSFIYYPHNESDKQLDRRKEELSNVITEILRRHPTLCYFQGFHDIAQVFLLVLGVENAADAVAHLSLLRIRDFMLPSLAPSLAHLRLLPAILYSTDAELCQHLSQTQPFFALAATLTLYAHDIQEYGDIARLFDFLLAQEAVVSVYLFAVIILSRRKELFEIPADEPEMLHSVLSKLPKPLDLEGLISKAMDLFSAHPPPNLPFRAWGKVSMYSVLKTTRGSPKKQTLQDGEELFEMQALQLRRAELSQHAMTKLWSYRRPAGSICLAVFIGIVSFWLRRSGTDGIFGQGLRKVLELFRILRVR